MIWPSRSGGRQRLYSMADIERVQRVKALTDEMGVNLAGVEVILRMAQRMNELQNHMKELESEVKKLRSADNL